VAAAPFAAGGDVAGATAGGAGPDGVTTTSMVPI
jgi:hypothetical protein